MIKPSSLENTEMVVSIAFKKLYTTHHFSLTTSLPHTGLWGCGFLYSYFVPVLRILSDYTETYSSTSLFLGQRQGKTHHLSYHAHKPHLKAVCFERGDFTCFNFRRQHFWYFPLDLGKVKEVKAVLPSGYWSSRWLQECPLPQRELARMGMC